MKREPLGGGREGGRRAASFETSAAAGIYSSPLPDSGGKESPSQRAALGSVPHRHSARKGCPTSGQRPPKPARMCRGDPPPLLSLMAVSPGCHPLPPPPEDVAPCSLRAAPRIPKRAASGRCPATVLHIWTVCGATSGRPPRAEAKIWAPPQCATPPHTHTHTQLDTPREWLHIWIPSHGRAPHLDTPPPHYWPPKLG